MDKISSFHIFSSSTYNEYCQAKSYWYSLDFATVVLSHRETETRDKNDAYFDNQSMSSGLKVPVIVSSEILIFAYMVSNISICVARFVIVSLSGSSETCTTSRRLVCSLLLTYRMALLMTYKSAFLQKNTNGSSWISRI